MRCCSTATLRKSFYLKGGDFAAFRKAPEG